MPRNPYSTSKAAERNGTAPPHVSVWGGNGRYAVRDIPESTDPEYTTGYSPALKAGGSPDGSALPDDIRIGQRDSPIPGRNFNDPRWQAREDSEFLERHDAERWTKGWRVQQRKAPTPTNPLWTQERTPTRPTADMAPMGTLFQRPWHIPRNIKDALGEHAVTHFSMADHRRVYPIMGMKPQGRVGTNTYRAQPRPWDENLFIPPPAGSDSGMLGGIAGNRTWRL